MNPAGLSTALGWILTAGWIAVVLALAAGMLRLKAGHGSRLPRITILIPARNEEAVIGRCLKAVAAQDYPADLLEVVVVDDNSSDRTTSVAEGFRDRILRLKVIPAGAPPAGIAPLKHAVTVGISAAEGEYILTTDADCAPPPGWAAGMVRCFAPDTAVVAGFSPLILPPRPGTGKRDGGQGFLAAAFGRFDTFVNGVVAAGSIGLGVPSTAVGRNLAWRRTAWDAAGGFGDTAARASGVDDLLLQRLSRHGSVFFAADPATFVPVAGPATLAEWLTRKRRHLSVGLDYRPGFVLAAAWLYLFNLYLAVGAVAAAVGLVGWQLPAVLWGCKALADGTTLAMGAWKLRLERGIGWLGCWLIGELVSPFIFAVLVPASLVGRIRWKGRELPR